MTLALAASLLLMAIVQFAAAGYRWDDGHLATEPVNWALGAKVPTLIAHGEYWRLVTASFLHGSWLHLAFNLLGLWVVGRLVEVFYGPARMLVIFVLSSVLGVVVSYCASLTTSLGASTGVMGLVGAVIWHNWKYRTLLPPRLWNAYRLLLFLVFLQFVMDLRSETVDAFGHLGGFLGGVFLATLLEGRIAGEAQGEREWLSLPTALTTTVAALVYGALGLVTTLPGSMDMLHAGAADSVADETAYMSQIVARRPYFTEARLHYSLLLLRQGREPEAKREYLAALSGNPAFRTSPHGELVRDVMVRHHLAAARALDEAGYPDGALDRYQQVLDLGARDTEKSLAYNNYAWLLVDRLNRDLPKAERYVNEALRLAPDHPAYLDTLAWIYYKTGRHEQALSTQLRAMQEPHWLLRVAGEDPRSAEMYYHLAAIYERLGKREEARENYTRALERQPDYPAAREGLRGLSDPDDPDAGRERRPEPTRADAGVGERRPG